MHECNQCCRAGATIEDIPNALLVPPVSVILKQQIVDVTEENGEEEPKKVSSLERNTFAVSGSVCQNKLSIHCFDVVTRAESPSSGKINICFHSKNCILNSLS